MLVYMLGMSGRTLHMFQSYLQLVALPVEPRGPVAALPAVRSGIELRDVWFRYAPDLPWVLEGLNLVVPRGAAVGLVGVNGAGKSTLVKLLCRLYEPERGQILWDGIDVRDLDPRALRRRIGATFQDFMTYDLTAGENVGLGDLDHMTDLARIRGAAGRGGIDGALPAYRADTTRCSAAPCPATKTPASRPGPPCPAASGSASRWRARSCGRTSIS